MAEKSKQTEKSRHKYKSKHWTSKCAHTDKKFGKSGKQIIIIMIVPLTKKFRHYTVENKVRQ